MASDEAHHPVITPARVWRRVVHGLLIVFVLLISFLAWLAGSVQGARTAFHLLGVVTKGVVQASDVQGRLIDQLTIGQLTIHSPARQLILHDLHLHWQPTHLRDRVLQIHALHIGEITLKISTTADWAPSGLPATLQLPVQIRLDDVSINRLRLVQADQTLAFAENTRLHGRFDGQSYALSLQSTDLKQVAAASIDGQLRGDLRLQADAPFRVESQLQLQGTLTGWRVRNQTRIHGPLSRVTTESDLQLTRDKRRATVTSRLHWQLFSSRVKVNGTIATSQLDLQSLQTGWPRTRLNAHMTLSDQQNGHIVIHNALPGRWDQARLPWTTATARIHWRDDHITLSEISIDRGVLTGHWEKQGPRWQARIRADRLNLKPWDRRLPATELSGYLHVSTSARHTDGPMSLDFTITDSKIGRHPFSGKGRIERDQQSWRIEQIRLRAGDNHLQAQGTLSPQQGDLRLTLDAANLSQISPALAGRLHVAARLDGPLTRPVLHARWQIHALQLAGAAAVQAGEGALHIPLREDGELFLHARLTQAVLAGTTLTAARVDLSGRSDAHLLSVHVATPRHQLSLLARGGLDALHPDSQWHGQLLQARATGEFRATLERSAALAGSRRHLHIEGLRLSSDLGRLLVDDFHLDQHRLISRGHLQGFLPARLAAAAGWSSLARSDLQLDGDWSVQSPHRHRANSEGHLRLHRTAGELRLDGPRAAVLRFRQLAAEARLREGRLSVQCKAESDPAGTLRFAAGIQLPRDATPSLNEAPIDGVLDASLPALTWLGPMIAPGLMTAGRLNAQVSVTGTWQAPVLAGTLAGERLDVRWLDQGVHWRDGRLRMDFRDDLLQLHELSFAGQAGGGRIAVSGPIRFRDGLLLSDLRWRVAQFLPFDRHDRQLVLTGDGELQTRARRVSLRGSLRVERGRIDLGREDKPQLSDDVIVVGRGTPPAPRAGLDMDVGIALGDALQVEGKGLRAHVTGALRIKSAEAAGLTAHGLVRVSRGTYAAYGRELTIERGVLRFDGSPGNPALDIRAMRRGTVVEAGIMMTGTAMAPRIRLVSEPAVPDAEKISWLVLGQGLSNTTDKQAGVLQDAAASLLTQSAAAGIQSQLAGSLGLDSITLSRRNEWRYRTGRNELEPPLEQRIITLGKRVSSRLYLSYQQGLQAAGSVILLRYTLSPRVTVEAETGTRSVFSLFYNFSFD